jgi:3-oxoacyl-ACP reductase-like protein
MSIFSKIKNAIFGSPAAAAETAAPASPASPASPAPSASAAPSATASAAAPAAGQPASTPVDVVPILDAAVKKSGQKLDWRHSIVDLMKALGMDASLAERKELAAELGYTGDTGDSAKMNMWLHKALMKKLSENGGQVPAELLD